jgi:hypothetical protein
MTGTNCDLFTNRPGNIWTTLYKILERNVKYTQTRAASKFLSSFSKKNMRTKCSVTFRSISLFARDQERRWGH